jgi:hypothetical protein
MLGIMAVVPKRCSAILSCPAAGEIFELEIDGSKPWNDPRAMPRGDGYPRWDEWDFKGRSIEGAQKRRFKLEAVDGCSNFDDVLNALEGRGRAPEGQWRGPFWEKYRLDTRDRIGFPDPSWTDERGDAQFPILTGDRSLFHHEDDIRCGGEGWLWLVEVVD